MDSKKIRLSNHALNKIKVLKEHGFCFSEQKIINAVRKADKIVTEYRGRKAAQKYLDEQLLIRIIFEEEKDNIKIITFYPAKRRRYENKL